MDETTAEEAVLDRNISIITDLKGNRIVPINDIIFKGKRSVNWDEVKQYLEIYVDEFYEIADTKDIVYIGKELPDEYTGSRYTYSLKGANAKAKANAAQGIPEMIEMYNVFHASILIRHDANGKMYLYDILDIKKETSNPFEP